MKLIKKSVLLILMLTLMLQGAEKKAVLKSILIPGWGEHSLNEPARSKIFMFTEAGLWITYAGLMLYKDIQYDDMKSYARAHSGASDFHGSSQYWVDMGSYLTWEDHREEMLEYRTPDKIYDEKYAWKWESVEDANTFRNIRVLKDRTEHRMTFILGGLVLNRLISVLDVVYLSRPVESGILLTPDISSFNISIALNP